MHGFLYSFKENYLKSKDLWNSFINIMVNEWYTPRFNVTDEQGNTYTLNFTANDYNVFRCPDDPRNYSRILNWYGEFDGTNMSFRLRTFTNDNASYPHGIYEFFQDPLLFIDSLRHEMCMLGYSLPEDPHNALEYKLNRFGKNTRRAFINTAFNNETSLFHTDHHTNKNTHINEVIYCGEPYCQFFANNLSLVGFEFTAGMKHRIIRDGVNMLQKYFKNKLDKECTASKSLLSSSTAAALTTGSAAAGATSLILNAFLIVYAIRTSRRVKRIELAQCGLDDTALLERDEQSRSSSVSSLA